MSSKFSRMLLDKPYLIWSVLFIIAPLVMVLYYALTDTSGAFSLKYIEAIPDYTPTILLSVLYGVLATVVCLVIGYPLAYFISKAKLSSQSTMILLVMLPMSMKLLIRTY
ncbi:MAG: ABC transporter permease, partial [Eubacterium sp.]|nr:ABC transporter permease [Eubacterium sp.]